MQSSGRTMGEAVIGVASADELLASLAASLRRGHWRVACRRYLMLRASGTTISERHGAEFDSLLDRCMAHERARMQRDAAAWAQMLQGGAAAVGDQGASSPGHGQVQASPAYKTCWRPLPACFSQGPARAGQRVRDGRAPSR
ncbi:hypothetical protein RA210_U150090 [Rubrivivax sp. A210]|nr:hypothetical protein RA210_U150090 [Rubrivivax sp. A210]